MSMLGKLLIVIGIILILGGILVIYLPRIPFLGKLPGDILIKKGNFTFYMPLATSLIISIVLTVLLWIFRSK